MNENSTIVFSLKIFKVEIIYIFSIDKDYLLLQRKLFPKK